MRCTLKDKQLSNIPGSIINEINLINITFNKGNEKKKKKIYKTKYKTKTNKHL